MREMIIVTGGAGFIGSAIVWKLNQQGESNILVVDELENSSERKNLRSLRFLDYINKDVFLEKVLKGDFKTGVRALIHMGACSDTTEQDVDYLLLNNYEYTKHLAAYATRCNVRFIYASSAATYGDGSYGYSDKEKDLYKFHPLNMYAYSKHLFDLWAERNGLLKQVAGLKFFNVFGPNEYHKGEMRSMVIKAFEQIKNSRGQACLSLFKSHRPEYEHGEQKRDFLYVKDAARMTLFFLQNPGFLTRRFLSDNDSLTVKTQIPKFLNENLQNLPPLNMLPGASTDRIEKNIYKRNTGGEKPVPLSSALAAVRSTYSMSKGLVTYSSAPAWRPRSISACWPLAVSIMM